MNLHLTGHHVEVTASIRDYVTAKLGRVERHFDQVIDVNVILSVDKLDRKVEANAHVPGKDLFVECHHTDMYAAIDNLADKLDRLMIKHKETHFNPRNGGDALKHHNTET